MFTFPLDMLIFSNNKIESLYASIVAILEPFGLKKTYRIVVEEASKLVDAEYGSIFIMKEGKLKRTYSTVPSQHEVQPREKGYSYKAYKNKQIYILGEKEIKSLYPKMAAAKNKSLILLPLFYGEYESLGLLALRSTKTFYFDKKKVDILKLFSTVAGLKIRSAHLQEVAKTQLKYRKEFAALASHELKTPLTIISLYTQSIEKRIIEGRPIKDDRFITIQTQVDKMTNIINEFLDPKEIGERKLKYKREVCNIYDLLIRIIMNYKVTNPERKIELKVGPDEKKAEIWADEEKIQGVFINIINNAIKYSPAKSIIIVLMKEKDGKVTVSFKDFGGGISKKDMPYIFEPFFRGGKQKKEGSGMGLYLSKNIISAHKGSIEAKSKNKNGTTIVIKLPLSKHARKSS